MKEFFENRESSFLFINDLKRVRYVGPASASGGFGLNNILSPNTNVRPHHNSATTGRQQHEQAVTDTLITTVRSFEELHQVTKGQGYEGVMTPEVFRALSRGEAVQVKIAQKAPERVNLLTPMVTAVMALFGGMSGAAYNDRLMTAIGNDARKAAEFVKKYGINYQFGIGTGQHIDRTVEFSVLKKDDDKKKESLPETKLDWIDWDYTTRPRPRGLNTTITDNFDRRNDYNQVEYTPDTEEPYVPPYLQPLNLSQNPNNPQVIGDIVDMRTFLNMTQREGYSSKFNLNELKSSGVLPPNATEQDMEKYVDKINSFFSSTNSPFQVKKQDNDYIIVDKNGKPATKEAFAENFLKKYGPAAYGNNTSSGDTTISSRIVGETDVPATYANGKPIAQGKANAVTDYSRMAMNYGAFDFSNPDNAFSIPEGGTIHTNRKEKWQQANQTFQNIENNIIDKPMDQLNDKEKELKQAYDTAFQSAFDKYKSMGFSDNVAKSRAKAEGIMAIGNKYIEQGRLLEGGKVFSAMVLKAEDHSGTYNGHIGAGHIGDVQGNNISEVNAHRKTQETGPAGGQQNFIPEANVYVDGSRAISKLMAGQNLDTEEENGLTNIVNRYNQLTEANPPLTVDKLKSDISSGNFSDVTKVLKFAKANLNEMKNTLESTGYEKAHPNLAVLSMELKEPNGIMSQIDSLISYTENPPVSNQSAEITTVNEASKAASLMSKFARGEQLSNTDQEFLTQYTGKSIEDLSKPDVLKEELGKVKTKLQESVSKLPQNNQSSVQSLISNIDTLTSQIESHKDKIGKSALSQRLDKIESKLDQFNDKAILSDSGIEKLKQDLKSVDKSLQEELKKAGVNLQGYIKEDGTLNLDKLLSDNKVPEHLKSDVDKFKKVSEKANSVIQTSIDAKNAIPEYNESIAEDENFPQIKHKLEESGLDLSSLKTNGAIDSQKVFKLAAFLDDVKTGKKTLDQAPQELKQIISDLQSKPELKQELETLGKNVNAYQKDRTKEQEFIDVLGQYTGTKHSYNKLQGQEKLTGKNASGLDVYGIYTGGNPGLQSSVIKLHEKGRPLSENDEDFKKVFDNVNGSVLFQGKTLTKDGEMTRDFLKLAAKAGIIDEEKLNSALASGNGKELAQLFLMAELKLHNEYGLKIDGQLGAEHMTDITHALRNKAQEYTTMANLFMDFYSSGEVKQFDDSVSQLDGDETGKKNIDMLKELIFKNKDAFSGKRFGDVPFDETKIEEFLQKVLKSEKGSQEFLGAIKGQLEGIRDTLSGTGFKEYGQAKELIDDINFVITGEKLGTVEKNAGINAMIKYVDETNGIGRKEGTEQTAQQYVKNISSVIDRLLKEHPEAPIKLGDHSFKNRNEAIDFLYKEYQKVLLSGFPITDPSLSPEKMADKFTEAFTKTSKAYDDVRETISLLGEANNREINFKEQNITVNNTPDSVMNKQINSLPKLFEIKKDELNVNDFNKYMEEDKKIKNLMKEILNSPDKKKVDDLLNLLKEHFKNVLGDSNDTRGDEVAKMYLAMAEKVIKKAEGKGPSDPPDFTDAFSRAKIPDSNGNVLSTSEALNRAIDTKYQIAN